MNLSYVSTDKLVVSTSCSLLHTAVDLVNEPKLDKEIKSWLAFAAQKVVEVNALAKALSGQKDEVLHCSVFSSYISYCLNTVCIFQFMFIYCANHVPFRQFQTQSSINASGGIHTY